MSKILALLLFAGLNLCAAEPTIRSMATQMVMVGFNGSSLSEASVKAVVSDAGYHRFGGVMLLGRNIKDKTSLKSITSALRAKNPKILISIDEEGGQVSRLKNLGYEFMSAHDIANSLDIERARGEFAKIAKALNEYSINVNFAPVVDLHDPNSPIIAAKKRAFSSSGAKVSLYAGIFMDAMRERGVISVMKHFPGHGGSHQDSHKDRSVVKLTRDALMPYRDLVRNDGVMVMSGHLYVSNIDESNPASLSSTITTSLLRTELGFSGVVISDDMLMGGITHIPLKERILRFINAGGDILLFSEFNLDGRKTAELVTQHIVDLVNEKRLSKERIEASYKRIMKLKEMIK